MIKKFYLSNKEIAKTILTLALPIIIANTLQATYQIADTFWLGRYSVESVAAVSLTYPIIFLLLSFGIGAAMAGGIFISQFKGKNDKKMINHYAMQTFILLAFIASIISVIGYTFTPQLINLMRPDVSIIADSISYMRIMFIGLLFIFLYHAFQGQMRSIGDSKTPMYVVLFTVIFNLIIDPLFIFGYGPFPEMGTSGAAIATAFSEGLAGLIGIYILTKGNKFIHLNWRKAKPDFEVMKKILKLGIPSTIDNSSRALGMVALMFLVTSFGVIPMAAYGIGSRIMSLVMFPLMGLSMATSVLVGNNVGIKNNKEAKKIGKVSISLVLIFTITSTLLIFCLSGFISNLFVPEDLEVIKSSTMFLRIVSLCFIFMGVQQIITGSFMGAGNTKLVMKLSVLYLWILQIPSAYILSKYMNFGEIGIWYSFLIAYFITCITTIVIYTKRNWIKKII